MTNIHDSISDALQIIAEQNNVTLEEVREEIQLAIMAGFNNSDPEICRRWLEIPCKGIVPTPEEYILYVCCSGELNEEMIVS